MGCGGNSGSVGNLRKLCKEGRLNEALQAVDRMHQLRIAISRDVVYCLLQGCTKNNDLAAGRRVHSLMVSTGLDSNAFLGDHLIRLFSSCGKLLEANQVFCRVARPSAYTWNAIISAHAKLGEGERALELYHKMQQEGVKPDKVIFLCILKACSSIGAIGQGKLIHDQIIRSGLESNVVIGNTLVDMYAKCGALEEARKVFDELPHRDVVSWGAMIGGYAQHGDGLPALELFEKMQKEDIKPNKVTFLCILKACGSIGAIRQGRMIHDQITRSGFESDMVIGSALVDMYSKCGSVEDSRKMFDKLQKRDVVSWGAMIAGYAQHGHGLPALELFEKMQQEGIKPNNYMFSSILKACGSIAALRQGRLLHDQIIKCGLESDVVIGNTLVDMYAKCGSLEEARAVFDKLSNRDVVSWNSMILGYAQHGHARDAFKLFRKMQQERMKPNKVTFLSVLKACSSVGAIGQGTLIHDQIIKTGLESDVVVGSTLVDMYAKCGRLKEARKVFDKLTNRNVVSWGAMIVGYAQHGHGFPALEFYEKMQQDGIRPDKVMFLCILKVCSSVGAVEQGRLIHDQIVKNGLQSDVAIGNGLVDMYAKCGSLDEAHKVFNELNRDVASWGVMMAGYARYGNCRLARKCFEDMQQQGLKPDDAIFTHILTACSHAGLLAEGRQYFKSMIEDHDITPNIEHYNCMVDLLGRAGCLNEAEELLQTMPIPPDAVGWRSLLTSCRTYDNMELGRRCFDQVVRLDPGNASAYVLMSNIYANAHMWEDVDRIQELRKDAGAWKKPGKAWIEVNNKVHEFIVGGKSHPQSDEIYAKLKRLSRLMKEEGYVPHLDLVLEPMSEEDKEDALCGHCEKLAIAYGLVSTPEGTTIRATKNLRVCADCHSASKIISKIERREIIIRDAYRIHHLKDGVCSCGDYF